MSRTVGAKNTMPLCSGSNQPMWGDMDRCLDCGRMYDDHLRPLVDPSTGVARPHMPVSKKHRRQRGLIG